MDRYQETAKVWNSLAQIYQDKFMYLDFYDESYDYVCHHVSTKNAQILELGCGPGNITRYLLNKRPDFQILGTDVAPNMLELAGKNCPEARFEIMDARNIAEIPSKFDAIIGGFCLPFLTDSDAQKLVQDCQDLLNDDGILYLSFMEGDPSTSHYKTGSNGQSVFFNFHLIESLQAYLGKHEFVNDKVFRVRYPVKEDQYDIHTILIAHKLPKD